jgi:sialic acid synthase SpsE
LDKSLPGTDHVLSVTPGELKELVKSVRELETMLGSHLKKPTADEERIKNVVRSRFPK